VSEFITPRATIARQAERAAEIAARSPLAALPPNPYDAHLQPDHFRCWECDFARYLAAFTAAEGTEGSA
jgi:hypothetical protein